MDVLNDTQFCRPIKEKSKGMEIIFLSYNSGRIDLSSSTQFIRWINNFIWCCGEFSIKRWLCNFDLGYDSWPHECIILVTSRESNKMIDWITQAVHELMTKHKWSYSEMRYHRFFFLWQDFKSNRQELFVPVSQHAVDLFQNWWTNNSICLFKACTWLLWSYNFQKRF